MWQPIESAPRDGTDILLWDGSQQSVARFEYETWIVGYGAERSPEPTHWMPLPDFPS